MAKLKLGKLYIYNRAYLKFKDTEELAAEYNRLRKIANKRLEVLSRSEFSTSQTYLRNRGKYNKTAREMSKTELLDALSAVAHFVASKTGSLRGLQSARKKAIERLRHPIDPVTGEPTEGYTFINKDNFQLFCQFMAVWKDEHPLQAGSPTPSELQDILKPGSKKLTPKEAKKAFEEYLIQHGYREGLA